MFFKLVLWSKGLHALTENVLTSSFPPFPPSLDFTITITRAVWLCVYLADLGEARAYFKIDLETPSNINGLI